MCDILQPYNFKLVCLEFKVGIATGLEYKCWIIFTRNTYTIGSKHFLAF